MNLSKEKEKSLRKKINFFEGIAVLFKAQFMDPLWKRYELENPKEALSLFLEGYAFSRNVRNLSYPHVAKSVLDKKTELPFPKEFWKKFKEELGSEKPNEKLNPLCHTDKGCKCALCVLRQEGYESKPNIVTVSRQLLENGEVQKTYKVIKRIRGIGPKITSLFLRDVADWFHVQVENSNRYLLQPIDAWVRRTVEVLSPNDGKRRDKDIGTWICEESRKFNANPEKVNQGIWYFGSQIAYSKFRLKKTLADEKYAYQLLCNYMDTLQGVAKKWGEMKKSLLN